MTTLEPGASDVFTHGCTISPRSTAFLASSPAATITDGFDVFVQLVIAAMTIEPWSMWNSPSSSWTETAVGGTTTGGPPGPDGLPPSPSQRCTWLGGFGGPPGCRITCSALPNDSFAPLRATRSCGRFGPATLGSTVVRSSSRLSE